MHKNKPSDKTNSGENWHKIYGKLAGNELHEITAGESKFFKDLIGKPFPYASYIANQKYDICLVGLVSTSIKYQNSVFDINEHNLVNENAKKNDQRVIISPGVDHIIEVEDKLLYISRYKEEIYDFRYAKQNQACAFDLMQEDIISGPNLSLRRFVFEDLNLKKLTVDDANIQKAIDQELERFDSTDELSSNCSSKKFQEILINAENLGDSFKKRALIYDIDDSELVIQKPQYPQYIGCFPIKCKLLKKPKEICCLRLDLGCAHRGNTEKTSGNYIWHNKCIILAAERATNGLFNFLLPLRAKSRSTYRIKPIILLLRYMPSSEFLESISCFPLIFWIEGGVSDISTLLKAGILNSDALVVVTPEHHEELEDESLYDSENIFAIQHIYRLFPRVKIISELRKASNIRFMKFRAKDMEKEKCSKLMYMHRTQFSSGSVFSASMIDTLLYQAFGKPYLIEFIRQLIGISQTEGSGNLSSIPLTEEDMWLKTYGNLYKKLAHTTFEIPIGLYRTNNDDTRREFFCQSSEVENLINSKLKKLKMNPDGYKRDFSTNHRSKTSYVLINPPHNLELQYNDVIYLLRPAIKLINNNSNNVI